MQKTFVFDEGLPKRIGKLEFDTFSALDVRKLSHLQVAHREMYQNDSKRSEYPNGPLDTRMGTGSKVGTCGTCGENSVTCVGHFGFVDFCVPVFHYGFFKTTHFTLQIICKNCSRILLSESDRQIFLKKMRACNSYHEKYLVIKEEIAPKCKRLAVCHFCGGHNGAVKKVGTGLKLIHERYKGGLTEEKLEEFENAKSFNSEIEPHLSKAQEDLDPSKVLRILEAIPIEDRELLDTPYPEKFILTNFPVPPRCIRPSVMMPGVGGSNEDDLTAKIADIVSMNNICQSALKEGKAINQIKGDWEYLQFNTAMYINSDTPGVTPPGKDTVKKIRALCQRLKGKHGRFRGNLSGKRVDFTARTVISPDPNLRIDQVAVPVLVAMVMTYPERVTDINLKKLQNLVIRGNEHPGANYVEYPDGMRKKLTHLPVAIREKIANQLKVGDVVERHMEDGDVILFNRQPSLHKLSIMSHRAKVMPWRTFRFNECVCTPYNADFDGDEMNLHLPQTEEARTEAWNLMSATRNLVTPRSGEPLIAAIQDFITASYLISRKDVFFTRDWFAQYCNYMFDAEMKIDLPIPAIQKPVQLFTGKQLFNVLFRPNRECNVLINHRGGGKNYKTQLEEMDPADTFVVIRNSELLCGMMDKAILGSGNKKNVFHLLLRDFGSEAAAERMSRLAKLCSRFLTDRGFSIGIDDVQPSKELNEHKQQVMDENYEKCEGFLRDWKAGKLEATPGCTVETTLERKMNKELSDIRTESGKLCSRYLPNTNSPIIMAFCGSKGSSLNISQMIACVGQQTVGGSRVAEGFINRTLPHFEFHSRSPEAKGFVKNSFYTGMTATEFFFHTMGGREGLVDTAVKTAETGYMARKLMKALEDLSVQYDHTVRNATSTIIQFEYGGDSLDPANMETDNKPMDFDRVLSQALALCPPTAESLLSPDEFSDILEPLLKSPKLSHCSENFMKTLREFLQEKLDFLHNQHNTLCTWTPKDKSSNLTPEQISEIITNMKAREFGLTEEALEKFLELTGLKYHRAIIEPGTAVGALGAQSISEPGTQMTLKTFHFAGVASMNITQGVPRIREIISATENISTPIVNAPLTMKHNLDFACIVKGRVERTTLGDISNSITKVFDKATCYVEVKISLPTIRELQLRGVSVSSIMTAIVNAKKVPTKDVTSRGDDTILVYPDQAQMKENLFFGLETLRNSLPSVLVQGISAVNRAVISIQSENPETYGLVAETQDLLSVMNVNGVVGVETTSNHVLETQRILGIEAARKTIINEISSTMGSHGIAVDTRHLMLLADIMTFKGKTLGIQRHGVQKMKDSVLMLASFEKTTDHLFDAAVYNRKDTIDGVSECIIVGAPVPLGTGAFKLVKKNTFVPRKVTPLLLDSPEFNLPFISSDSSVPAIS